MWEKFKAQVTTRPWLFGGVAIAVLLWIFWPRGGSGGGNNDAAVQSQAIAQTAMANASLMLANEETRRVAITTDAATQQFGIQAETAKAINAAQIAGVTQLAQIESGAFQYQQDTAVKLADIQAGAQGAVYDAILASQESAQKWALDVENQADILPGKFEVLGFTNNAPSIVRTPQESYNPLRVQPVAAPAYDGSPQDLDRDGVYSSMDFNDSDPSIQSRSDSGVGGGGGK